MPGLKQIDTALQEEILLQVKQLSKAEGISISSWIRRCVGKEVRRVNQLTSAREQRNALAQALKEAEKVKASAAFNNITTTTNTPSAVPTPQEKEGSEC